MKIGILAVQGDYEAHARMLERLGADYILVRTPQEAAQVDAMILPGGESTTMLKFLKEEGLEAPLRALAARGGLFSAPAPAPFCWPAKCALPRRSRSAWPIW